MNSYINVYYYDDENHYRNLRCTAIELHEIKSREHGKDSYLECTATGRTYFVFCNRICAISYRRK